MDRFLGTTVILILFLASLAVLAFYGFRDFEWLSVNSRDTQTEIAEIFNISVERPFLVINGQNLDEVLIYINRKESGSDFELWGEASYNDHDGRWFYDIPDKPELIYIVEARGYKDDELIGSVNLRTRGATDIYNQLWSLNQSFLLPLRVGQTGTYGDLSLRLERILEDSRCILETNCPIPGDVLLEVFMVTVNEEERAVIRLSQEPVVFADFSIRVIDVSPLPLVSEVGMSADYIITFSITLI